MEGVDTRYYNVIYNLVDDIGKALKGMLEPTYAEVVEGRAEVRAVFGAGKNIKIAGSMVRGGWRRLQLSTGGRYTRVLPKGEDELVPGRAQQVAWGPVKPESITAYLQV